MPDLTENNPNIFTFQLKPLSVTARDIGIQLAADPAAHQAAMLAWWADSVLKYKPGESWTAQCRMIAEQMTDEQCLAVRFVLHCLVNHLEATPKERALSQPIGV